MKKVAGVCLVPRGPLVLAVTRGSNLNDLGLPGGKQEPGETPENCAIRELAEETNLFTHDLNLIDINNDEFGYLVYTYEVKKFTGQLKSSIEGKALWVEPKQLIQSSCTFKKANKRILKKIKLI